MTIAHAPAPPGVADRGDAEHGAQPQRRNAAASWRECFRARPCVQTGASFADYEPAYRFGADAWRDFGQAGRAFGEIEDDLALRWELCRGGSALDWREARLAVLDGWMRERDAAPMLLRALAHANKE